MKWLLFWMYFSRAAAIGVYLLAPKTALTFYVFAAVLGFTWLATVPPTAGLVGKLFGVRYLATLFGLTLLSHQIGGFFGAWLGGIALVSIRRLRLDVVRGHGARARRRAGQPADPRGAPAARAAHTRARMSRRRHLCRRASASRMAAPRKDRSGPCASE